jgi:hypothetical protein
MSQDARNSIYLWIGSLAVFGFLWANISFDLLPVPDIPNEWLWPILGMSVLMNVAGEIANYRGRRRAAKSEGANTSSGN